jgi:prepilin-type N-terminal cleavage/methylation domain-containing protein
MIRVAGRVHARAATGGGAGGGDGGFSLVEMLVAISIFAVLSTAVISGLTSTVKTVNDVRAISNLTEEARVATERMARELRQSSTIIDAHLPNGSNDYTWVKFGVDFNGDGLLEANAVDPEIVTYRYEPGTRQLTFTANDTGGSSVTRPILAANVTGFQLSFTSSLWEQDTNRNGVTDWTEIDASTIGNRNGIFDSGEFDDIDSIGITLQLLEGAHTQTYTTQVDLRNQNQN